MKTRKELQDEYKNRKLSMGVYQIRNMLSGKVYIDHSLNLDTIYNRIKLELNVNRHANGLLQKDWNEFGEENFKYEVLAELKENSSDDATYRKEAKVLCEMFKEEMKQIEGKCYNS